MRPRRADGNLAFDNEKSRRVFRLLGRPGEALRGQAMALGVVLAVLTVLSVLVIERLRPKDALGW